MHWCSYKFYLYFDVPIIPLAKKYSILNMPNKNSQKKIIFTFKLGVKPPFFWLLSWMDVDVTQMKPFRPNIIDTPHGKLTKWTFCLLIKGELTWIRQPCPNLGNKIKQNRWTDFFYSYIPIIAMNLPFHS
jgi:hypothetical protein